MKHILFSVITFILGLLLQNLAGCTARSQLLELPASVHNHTFQVERIGLDGFTLANALAIAPDTIITVKHFLPNPSTHSPEVIFKALCRLPMTLSRLGKRDIQTLGAFGSARPLSTTSDVAVIKLNRQITETSFSDVARQSLVAPVAGTKVWVLGARSTSSTDQNPTCFVHPGVVLNATFTTFEPNSVFAVDLPKFKTSWSTLGISGSPVFSRDGNTLVLEGVIFMAIDRDDRSLLKRRVFFVQRFDLNQAREIASTINIPHEINPWPPILPDK
jgi:V8-like Glu-specific endopeptidase